MTEGNDNVQLIERFYGAFADRDGEAMAACYSSDVQFSDPVFPDLRGDRAGNMWRMLTEQGRDLQIELLEHDAEGDAGSAHWRATYTFTATGRKVVNDVKATLRFADGRIAEHHDDFDFHRWARQALGPMGLLLGWTPIVKGSVRKKAAERLEEYSAKRGSGETQPAA